MNPPPTVHASALLLGETGILVRGASGSGKSSILLALLGGNLPARLVADDRVALSAVGGRLLAAPPAELAGLLEVRGQGIIRRPFVSPVVVGLVVDLLPSADCPRMPEAGDAAIIAGVAVRRLKLPVGAPDAAIRIVSAVSRLRGKVAARPA
jgi:serine kinase of HPr protein (carbohydrate metabolism regulator)